MIKIKPNKEQIKIFEEIFDVTRYLYNKVNSAIKDDISLYNNSQRLRDKYVTKNTKKTDPLYDEVSKLIKANQKLKEYVFSENEVLLHKIIRDKLSSRLSSSVNIEIQEFEKKISKSIRDNTVRNICANYKSAISNLKAGNIKYFNIGYKKKSSPNRYAKLAENDISIKDGNFIINSSINGSNNCKFKIGKRNTKRYGKTIIKNGCDLFKNNNGYFIGLVIPVVTKVNKVFEKICGVDPGIRTLLTTFGSTGVSEYKHNSYYIKKINEKIKILKSRRTKRVRKKTLSKYDRKKSNYVDDIHWKSITHLLKNNDVIFFGDIKSHGIVKKCKNKTLNRNFNDLKFFQLKQRLIYKAKTLDKKIVMVYEAYTTQGCSNCGNLCKTIGSSKTYNCSECESIYDRDINSAKNILMKGLLLEK